MVGRTHRGLPSIIEDPAPKPDEVRPGIASSADVGSAGGLEERVRVGDGPCAAGRSSGGIDRRVLTSGADRPDPRAGNRGGAAAGGHGRRL